MFDELLKQAAQVDRQYRDNLSLLKNRDDLSPKGREDAARMFKENYDRAVGELKQRADLYLEAERSKVAKEKAAAREKAVADKRAILGDQVLAGIYQARLSSMAPEDIVAAYQEAAGAWEKTLVGELGRAILEQRAAAKPTEDNFLALRSIDTDAPDLRAFNRREATLRRNEEEVARLDPVAYREQVGATFGVNPNYVDAAVSE